MPVRWKCPTLTHSVRPTRTRRRQRLVHVAEHGPARAVADDRGRAAPGEHDSGPARHHVVGQVRDGGRDVRAQHVDARRARSQRGRRSPPRSRRYGHPRRAAARLEPRAAAARRRRTRTAARRSPTTSPSSIVHAVAGELAATVRAVDVAGDRVGRRRHRGEQLGVLLAHGLVDDGGRRRAPLPQRRANCISSPVGAPLVPRSQPAKLLDLLGAEHATEDAPVRGRGSRRSRSGRPARPGRRRRRRRAPAPRRCRGRRRPRAPA